MMMTRKSKPHAMTVVCGSERVAPNLKERTPVLLNDNLMCTRKMPHHQLTRWQTRRVGSATLSWRSRAPWRVTGGARGPPATCCCRPFFSPFPFQLFFQCNLY
ncbi:hypothetical protein SEVIR_1G231233v4 [Setaria viridis]